MIPSGVSVRQRFFLAAGATLLLPFAASAQAPTDLVIKNATVMTASHGTIHEWRGVGA